MGFEEVCCTSSAAGGLSKATHALCRSIVDWGHSSGNLQPKEKGYGAYVKSHQKEKIVVEIDRFAGL
jgi:poly-beta-hydroxyalkanoate depolymerase